MNILKNAMVLILIFSSVFACRGHKNSAAIQVEKYRTRDKMMSDSLRTPKKRAELTKLTEVLSENLATKDNHIIFKLSKKDFKKTGLPEEYYHRILRELKTNNEFIDANNLNADELLKTIDSTQKAANDL